LEKSCDNGLEVVQCPWLSAQRYSCCDPLLAVAGVQIMLESLQPENAAPFTWWYVFLSCCESAAQTGFQNALLE